MGRLKMSWLSRWLPPNGTAGWVLSMMLGCEQQLRPPLAAAFERRHSRFAKPAWPRLQLERRSKSWEIARPHAHNPNYRPMQGNSGVPRQTVSGSPLPSGEYPNADVPYRIIWRRHMYQIAYDLHGTNMQNIYLPKGYFGRRGSLCTAYR